MDKFRAKSEFMSSGYFIRRRALWPPRRSAAIKLWVRLLPAYLFAHGSSPRPCCHLGRVRAAVLYFAQGQREWRFSKVGVSQ